MKYRWNKNVHFKLEFELWIVMAWRLGNDKKNPLSLGQVQDCKYKNIKHKAKWKLFVFCINLDILCRIYSANISTKCINVI